MERFDAVVVGGGPAGSAFAIALAAAGWLVAVLDRSAPPGPRSGDVLPPEVRPVLEDLGVWDRLRSDGHLRSPGILSVWGQDEPAGQDFIWSPYGDGWQVDRSRFDEMLLRAAEEAGAGRAPSDSGLPERRLVFTVTRDGRSRRRRTAAFFVSTPNSSSRPVAGLPHSPDCPRRRKPSTTVSSAW